MRQSFWHQTGNLWALGLSTVIALFLPDFGPESSMSDGVGVVIRTTIIAPVVFSLLYWGGRLIFWLAEKLIGSPLGQILKRWGMSIITAGFEQGLRNAAERRAKKLAPEMAQGMAQDMAQDMARDMVQAAEERAAQAVAAAEKAAVAAAATEKAASDQALQQEEAYLEFMRSQGISDAAIDAFIRRRPGPTGEPAGEQPPGGQPEARGGGPPRWRRRNRTPRA